MSLFSAVEMAPRDPILGLNEAFNADTRTTKVNLGVGVYCNEEGKIPLLRAVAEAEAIRVAQHAARGYLPIDGIAAYDKAVQTLLFGEQSPLLSAGRVTTVQAVGGTGALKIGADFLKQLLPDAVVAISDPSWENHRALFETAGFPVQNYRYYDAATHDVNRAGLLEDLNALPPQSIVVLHACCHNPTGVDLSPADWQNVLDVVKAIADEEGAIVVPVCNKIEAEIAELDDGEEKDMFLEALGLEEPGLNRVIRAGYEMLNLQTYFTAGVEEVRAWTVKVGATAPQAAGVIHTDFEKGFIRAEVIAYNDFIQYKGEAGAKEAGKWRLEGKEYIVKDGDVMHFRFNV